MAQVGIGERNFVPCRAGLLERMRVQIAAYGTLELHATLGGVGVLGGTPAVDCL